MRGVYTIHQDRVASGAAVITPIEAETTTSVVEILEARVLNTTSEVSEQWSAALVTKSADGTNVTTPIVVAHDLAMAAHGMTVRGQCTAVGTIDNVFPYGHNVLNGWEYIASEDGKIWIAAAKTFGLHLHVAPPTSLTVSYQLVVKLHA